MAHKSNNGHRTKKDGTIESFGEVHDRLQIRMNAKIIGAAGLAMGGLMAVFDGAVSNHPVLQSAMSYIVNDLQTADSLSSIAQIFGGMASAAGAVWATVSASKDAEKLRGVNGYMASVGRDYRPGDRAKEEAKIFGDKGSGPV